MNVLSLFDGISCGQIALKRANIVYDNYFASEIDKNAIKVTQYNFPNTIQLGDIRKINGKTLPKIDLLIGGSPCQGFSFSGKELNFNDPRSKLFFEFARLLHECKPKFWLLENVVMRKEFENTISKHLGSKPIMINSSLVSAQNRKRLYWSNFPINQPPDKHINLHDILESSNKHLLNKATIIGRRLNQEGKREDYNKEIPIVQYLEVREINSNKSNCLTTVAKDNVLTTLPPGRYANPIKNKLPFRYYTTNEYCRLQNVPENYFNGTKTSDNQIRKMLGNGWTVNVIVHIFKEMINNETIKQSN